MDSTRVVAGLGDEAASALWTEHDRLARDLLAAWHGREIDKSDGFLLIFDAVEDALHYAIAYHEGLRRLATPLEARAGLHFGEVVFRETPAGDVALGAKPVEIDGAAKPLTARVMQLAGAGQTFLTESAARCLGASERLFSHGYWRLKGIAAPVRIHEFVGAAGGAVGVPKRSANAFGVSPDKDLWLPVDEIAYSLPVESDRFVGRGAMLLDLQRRFDSGVRLVSLLGPGGVGKTRLALRYGWATLGGFPGGVWHCACASATTREEFLQSVATGLQLPPASYDVQQLAAAIAARERCLVIFDNLEQLLPHASPALGAWLQGAPRACLLATTRRRLGIAGEDVLRVGPLTQSEGVALLVVRAKSTESAFEVAQGDRRLAGELVELLDGLPLAIELAASRANVLSLSDMRRHMGDRFRLLSSRTPSGGRSATLRRTLEWSWSLMTTEERIGLAQLSAFAGPFTAESADAVLDFSTCDPAPWSVDVIDALVNASLLVRAGERFDMLLTIREYAAEKLAALGEAAEREARRRHFLHFATLEEAAARAGARAELPDYLTACRHATEAGEARTAADLLMVCWSALKLIGPIDAAVGLAREVRSICGDDPWALAATAWVSGSACQFLGDMQRAEEWFRESRLHARDSGYRLMEAYACCSLGEVGTQRGDLEGARRHFDRAEAIVDALADRSHLRVRLLNSSATLFHVSKSYGAALAEYGRALDLARSIGDRRWEGGILANIANVEHLQGRRGEAVRLYEEALELSMGMNDLRWAVNTECNLGLLHHEIGDSVAGAGRLEHALKLAREIGLQSSAAIILCNLGMIADEQGRPDRAREWFGECMHISSALKLASLEATASGYLAVQCAALGMRPEADRWMEHAGQLTEPLSDPSMRALLQCQQARLAEFSGAAGEARRLLECARNTLEAEGDRSDGEVVRLVARVARDFESVVKGPT